ncbi:hypothetical protein C8Q77DRAFT_1160861 [Trametes polyzona]|nr:hypothetical protein C8Q77DRAFT_1160861 [Trametes polyzona]
MQLPYFQILALAFVRFFIIARAIPSGTGLEARANADPAGMVAGAAVNFPKEFPPKLDDLKPLQKRDLPVNIMRYSDASRPMVPVDNYRADMARLMGGQE